jgi:parallel beta-helix repeat protein
VSRLVFVVGWAAAAIGLVAAPSARAQTAPNPCLRPEQGDSTGVYSGTGDRQLSFYTARRALAYPCDFPDNVRAVIIEPDRLLMIEGGQLEQTVPRPPGPLRFEDLTRLVNDTDWIKEVSSGVFEMYTTVFQQPGTELIIAAPAVTTLRLVDAPYEFLGGSGAKALIEGATVTSWAYEGEGPDTNAADGRPFILYEDGSRLDIRTSTLQYLGSDRTGGAYGVAWRTGGSTGEVIESVFQHNFFGVYTFEAKDMVFRGNVFRNNDLYGWDPHDFSTNLLAEDNEAYGNGSHGFIVSRHVTGSVLRNNRSYDNHGNGIVIDFRSDGNLVEGNTVLRNGLDGIVVLGSSSTVVRDNVVRNNNVGIRVNLPGSGQTLIERNLVEANAFGMKIYGGARAVDLRDNRVVANAIAGIILDAPESVLSGGVITGGQTGLIVRTEALARDVAIRDSVEGISVEAQGILRLEDVRVDAKKLALRVARSALTWGTGMQLNAERTVIGQLQEPRLITRPAAGGLHIRWQFTMAVGLVMAALLLQGIYTFRTRPRVLSVLEAL